MTTLPFWSTATQRLIVGQDTEVRKLEPFAWLTDHVAGPPVGLLEVATLPP